jgi:DNA-binding CsgD family transcriptional regulator
MTESRIRFLLALVAIGAFSLIMWLEIATESDEIDLADVAVDALVLFLTIASAAAVVLLLGRVERQREETRALVAAYDVARREGAEWRAAVENHVEGLKSAIERQFEEWSMTPAERDIAFFILKGYSHKEIARLRDTSERTIRQQAQSIYRKSGLSGKNALSAYFLEDLLSPRTERNGDGWDQGTARAAAAKAPTH